jgi:hypothetical protein
VTQFTYRAAFPIVDDSLRVSQVINRAVLLFPDYAHQRGVMILGEVAARLDGNTVVCEALAEEIPNRKHLLADVHGPRIADLNSEGFSDRQIGERLGLPASTVCRIRYALSIPRVGRTPTASLADTPPPPYGPAVPTGGAPT